MSFINAFQSINIQSPTDDCGFMNWKGIQDFGAMQTYVGSRYKKDCGFYTQDSRWSLKSTCGKNWHYYRHHNLMHKCMLGKEKKCDNEFIRHVDMRQRKTETLQRSC